MVGTEQDPCNQLLNSLDTVTLWCWLEDWTTFICPKWSQLCDSILFFPLQQDQYLQLVYESHEIFVCVSFSFHCDHILVLLSLTCSLKVLRLIQFSRLLERKPLVHYCLALVLGILFTFLFLLWFLHWQHSHWELLSLYKYCWCFI